MQNDTINSSRSIDPALANFDSLPDAAHVRPTVAKDLLGVSMSTFWNLVRDGHLKTTKLTPRTTTVKAGDIRAFMRKDTRLGDTLKAALKKGG